MISTLNAFHYLLEINGIITKQTVFTINTFLMGFENTQRIAEISKMI